MKLPPLRSAAGVVALGLNAVRARVVAERAGALPDRDEITEGVDRHGGDTLIARRKGIDLELVTIRGRGLGPGHSSD